MVSMALLFVSYVNVFLSDSIVPMSWIYQRNSKCCITSLRTSEIVFYILWSFFSGMAYDTDLHSRLGLLDINEKDEYGLTPLCLATTSGQVMQSFLQHYTYGKRNAC